MMCARNVRRVCVRKHHWACACYVRRVCGPLPPALQKLHAYDQAMLFAASDRAVALRRAVEALGVPMDPNE